MDVEGLGAELARLYGELEDQLAAGTARRIAAGIDRPDWQSSRMAAAGELRRWATALVAKVNRGIGKRARAAVQRGYETGAGAAQRELAGVARRRTELGQVRREIPGAQNIDRLAAALAGRLDATQPRVVRSVVDAYRTAVTAGAATVLGGADTRREASGRVWNRLLDQGFAGFTDVRGRNWSLAGYVEMATRTTVAQAAVAGQLDRMAELDLNLCIVSDAPQECERCRPWEGEVLTRDDAGRGGATLTVQSEAHDGTERVKVAGSVDEAIGAGLMHPNCRHSLSAYLPGLTKAPPAGTTADPEGDAARQRLRALERQVRAAKRQEAGALTPEAKAKAQQRAATAQAKIRDHVKATKHLGIKRKIEREQLDLGNARTPAPAPPARTLTRAERLNASMDSGVASEERLGGGVMARTDLVTTNDGARVVRKRSLGYTGRTPAVEQDAEELGALVARAAGGRAPAVARRSPDTVAMEYVDGSVWDELDDAAQATLLASDDARRIGVADVLMGNTDRNGGNVMVAGGDRLHGIDHGSAFDWHPDYNPPSGAPRVGRNVFASVARLQPGEGAALRTRLDALQPEFERLGHLDWHAAMLQRLALLEGS